MAKANKKHIRMMEARDIPIVSEIAREVMSYPWSKNIFSECFKEDYQAWVMADGQLANNVLGFAVVLSQLGECQLLNVSVRASRQREGVGKQLMSHIIDYALGEKLSRIFLEIRQSNTVALSLYRSMGFCQVGIRKAYYPSASGREDAYLLRMNLVAAKQRLS